MIRGDLGTLTGAEMNGAPIALGGDALMSGYYLNELMLNLLHRHDPQPEMYAAYSSAVAGLNGAGDVAVTLRRFEMEALGLLGYALSLDQDAVTGMDLEPDRHYEYRIEQGPVAGQPRWSALFHGQRAAIDRSTGILGPRYARQRRAVATPCNHVAS